MNLTEFGTQCVQFVEAVLSGLPGFRTPSAPGGGLVQTAAEYAGSGTGSLSQMGWSQVAPGGTILPGDLVVEQPGTLGVSSAGHVQLVSGSLPGGGVATLESNVSGTGSPPQTGSLSASQLGAKGLTVWQPPAGEQTQAAALTAQAVSQLGAGGGGQAAASTLPGSSSAAGGTAQLASYQLAGDLGTQFGWWDPRSWVDATAGFFGSAAGTAAGAAASAIATGVLAGTEAGVGAVYQTTVGPWFKRQVVPLVVGVVIVLIIFGTDGWKTPRLVPRGGGGGGEEEPEEMGAAAEPGIGEAAAVAAA